MIRLLLVPATLPKKGIIEITTQYHEDVVATALP
jgi:hypothetical protein